MITIIDLYRNLKMMLEKEFVKIPVQIKDIKNPKLPCFYIKIISSNETTTAQEFKQVLTALDVIYFAKEDNLLEMLQIQDKLSNLFDFPLKVQQMKNGIIQTKIDFVEINDKEFTLDEDDYVLHCVLDIEVINQLANNLHDRYLFPDGYYGIPRDSNDLMEILELELNKN